MSKYIQCSSILFTLCLILSACVKRDKAKQETEKRDEDGRNDTRKTRNKNEGTNMNFSDDALV